MRQPKKKQSHDELKRGRKLLIRIRLESNINDWWKTLHINHIELRHERCWRWKFKGRRQPLDGGNSTGKESAIHGGEQEVSVSYRFSTIFIFEEQVSLESAAKLGDFSPRSFSPPFPCLNQPFALQTSQEDGDTLFELSVDVGSFSRLSHFYLASSSRRNGFFLINCGWFKDEQESTQGSSFSIIKWRGKRDSKFYRDEPSCCVSYRFTLEQKKK